VRFESRGGWYGQRPGRAFWSAGRTPTFGEGSHQGPAEGDESERKQEKTSVVVIAIGLSAAVVVVDRPTA
jgi:hypothetical protein